MHDIFRLSPFPATTKSAVPDNFHTCVQIVELNDDENIIDIRMKDDSESEDESEDSTMD